MATFDAHVRRVADYVDALRTMGRPTRHFAVASSVAALTDGLPVRVGPGANPNIILRGDTFIELGSPEAGSCALALWTDTPSLIRDGQITLVGPDMSEAPGATLPFGQVVLVGGTDLSPADHQSVGQAQYVADQIEGYMVRATSRNMWTRVSKDAAAKGFGFEALGRALMAIYRSTVPRVQAIEIIFVTTSKDDVLGLDDIAGGVRDRGAEIVKDQWKARGFDLDCDLDCRSCHDKDVCDDVRKLIAGRMRKKRKAAARRVA